MLRAYSWPGNVRELRNVVERAVLLAESDVLEPSDFESLHTLPNLRAQTETSPVPTGGIHLPDGGIDLDDVEKRLIELALQRTNGNQTRAAALLGLHRDQIRYRMEKYGLLKPS
jgi:DNA-binding NtrC family response regulator